MASKGGKAARARLAAIVVLLLAWIASLPLSTRYVIADSPYGRIGDGDSMGYERARGIGLAHGCAVFQTIHRTPSIGWQLEMQDFHFRIWMVRENVEGSWTNTTSGISLLVPALFLAATIRYGRNWRRVHFRPAER